MNKNKLKYSINNSNSIILSIITILFTFIFNSSVEGKSINNFKIPDSLKNKTYNELNKGFKLHEFSNPKIAKIYSKTFLLKATKAKDSLKIAKAYSQLSSLTKDYTLAMEYSSKVILYSKKAKDNWFPAIGYIQIATINNAKGFNTLALKYYLTAQEFALKQKNEELAFFIKNEIAQLKNLWGNSEEAIAMLNEQLKILHKRKPDFKNKNALLCNTYLKLSNAYLTTYQIDSSHYFNSHGIKESLSLKCETKYYEFVVQSAKIAFHQKKYLASLDSLNKALPFEYASDGFFNNYYYQAKNNEKLNDTIKAFFYFSKADSIYSLTNSISKEVLEVQKFFINYYKNKNDLNNQLKYTNLLLKTDSIFNANSLIINQSINKNYNNNLLLLEKQQLISNLKIREKKSNIYIYSILTIISLILFFTARVYKEKQTYKKRYKELTIPQVSTEKPIENKTNYEIKGVSKETIETIALSLQKFEDNQGYLDNSVSLNSLALAFNTNSNYLSKVVNTIKEQNFSSYLTDLRILYTIEKIKSGPVFRKYDMKSIAFEVGFKSVETFSKAFYKKTGLYPSNFIRKIEEE